MNDRQEPATELPITDQLVTHLKVINMDLADKTINAMTPQDATQTVIEYQHKMIAACASAVATLEGYVIRLHEAVDVGPIEISSQEITMETPHEP